MKIIVTLVLFFAASLAEPPVDSRYLPPVHSSGGLETPSRDYGTPGTGSSQRLTTAIFRPRPSSRYGAPTIQQSTLRRPSVQYGAPSNQHEAPSQLYGAPRSSQMSASGSGSNLPSPLYLPSSAPSQQYGAPGFGNGNSFASGQSGYEGAQSRQYLPPGRRGDGGDDGSSGEPANYSFEYMVKDDASGNDFGHREARQGDRAEGLYYVLLPDGRKQTVEYEADQNGYKPRISYQDTGLGNSGFGGSQRYSRRYPSQEGPY